MVERGDSFQHGSIILTVEEVKHEFPFTQLHCSVDLNPLDIGATSFTVEPIVEGNKITLAWETPSGSGGEEEISPHMCLVGPIPHLVRIIPKLPPTNTEE